MLERWEATASNFEADQTLKTILFLPDFKADAKPLARLAEVVVSGDKGVEWYEWWLLARGIYDLRTGNRDAALAHCRESRRRAPTSKGSAGALTASNLVIESMALLGKGDTKEARRTLEKARPLIERYVPGLDRDYWHDWLAARLLFREAEGLIARKKAEPK
jgi:hypothetical protein